MSDKEKGLREFAKEFAEHVLSRAQNHVFYELERQKSEAISLMRKELREFTDGWCDGFEFEETDKFIIMKIPKL